TGVRYAGFGGVLRRTPVNDPDLNAAEQPPSEAAAPADEAPPTTDRSAAPSPCPQCQSPRAAEAAYCGDCGYIFAAESSAADVSAVPDRLVAGRFKLERRVGERAGVARFRGDDVDTLDKPIPVIVIRQVAPPAFPMEASAAKEPRESSELDFDLAEV